MNKKDFPIILLRAIREVVKTSLHNEIVYSDLVYLEIVDYNIKFKDADRDSIFHFSLSNPSLSGDSKAYYKLTFLPHTVNSVQEYSTTINVNEIENYFTHWVGMLKEYNSISLSQEDEFVKQYQEEYFEEWKIVDEDADTKPFNDQQQTAIFNLLEYVETKLKENKDQDIELTDIIQETESLKNNIQNLTKNAVIKGLSRVFAKIKKKGLPLLFELLKEVKKEIIKKVINEGFEILPSLLHQITQ